MTWRISIGFRLLVGVRGVGVMREMFEFSGRVRSQDLVVLNGFG